MKKILHISKYYSPYSGGVEDVCLNIVQILQNTGVYQQYILCFNDSKNTINELIDNIPVLRVGINSILASQPITYNYGHELKKLLTEFDPDVVHFHVPNPLATYYLLKMLPKNTKLVVHWHSDIVAQQILYKLIKPLETKLLNRANLIVTTSPNYAENSLPLKKFVDKIYIIPNVINPSKFALNDVCIKQVYNIKQRYDGLPIILFVGRHVVYKGLEHLVHAAKYIKSDCVIVIGGCGPLTKQLKEKSIEFTNVKFIGQIPDNELTAYYYAATLFAFPSVTRNEAFGVALAEAMYCSTPAITFTIPGSGVNWVNIGGHTGLEVENGNAKALASAIDKLITDHDLCQKMANNAKKRVESLFTPEKIANKINTLYHNE